MENEREILNKRIEEVQTKEEQEFIEEMTEYVVSSLDDINLECQPEEISQALKDAIERNKLYSLANDRKAKLYYEKYDIHPATCKNSVCEKCHNNYCTSNSSPVGCLFRMVDSPPNDLNYDEEYVPSHREALDMLEKHGLLKGDRLEYNKASVYYGKANNYEERNNTEVKGISMSQLEFCAKSAIESYMSFLKNYDNIDISENIDVDVIARNTTINVEKAMGIYPNINIR